MHKPMGRPAKAWKMEGHVEFNAVRNSSLDMGLIA
jgi:hypothetical protein